jgi:hypothetical protein
VRYRLFGKKGLTVLVISEALPWNQHKGKGVAISTRRNDSALKKSLCEQCLALFTHLDSSMILAWALSCSFRLNSKTVPVGFYGKQWTLFTAAFVETEFRDTLSTFMTLILSRYLNYSKYANAKKLKLSDAPRQPFLAAELNAGEVVAGLETELEDGEVTARLVLDDAEVGITEEEATSV